MNVFKKSAIAIAVASACMLPLTTTAGELKISGIVEAEITDSDASGSELSVELGDVNVKFKYVEDVKVGQAYAIYRVDADGPSGSITTADSVTVGLKGDFGDVSFGEVNIPIEEVAELANDIVDIEQADYDQDIGYNKAFGPITAFAAFSPEGNDDHIGFGAQYNANGITVGAGYESTSDTSPSGEETTIAVGGKYATDMFSAAAHFAMYDEADRNLLSAQGKFFAGDWTYSATFTTLEDVADWLRGEATYQLGPMTYVNFRLTSMSPDVGDEVLTYRALLGVEF